MAAYAALVSLMNNIEQIQQHTRLPISLDQKQTKSLHGKVIFLINFLESYNYHGVSKEMNDLESRITDVAYAAEDIIETHVVDGINAYSRSLQEENEIMTRLTELSQTRNPTFIDILNIMSQVTMSPINDHSSCSIHVGNNPTIELEHELTGSMERLTVEGSSLPIAGMCDTEKNQTVTCLPGIDKLMEDMDLIMEDVIKIENMRRIDGSQTTSQMSAHTSSSIHVGNNAMIGFDSELNTLLERLTGEGLRRQVIPIVGMGGIGKTTLAKTTYEKPLIVEYFDMRAWVSVSQEYSLRQILLRLMGDDECSQMSDRQLGDRLYKSLCGIRYLIVLDDLWSVEAWEMVKVFFPEYKNGSRVIVTTRISSLAAYFGWCNLEMNFLNEEEGWNLFCGKVFGQEGCPRELEEVGRKIVKNCQRLPLSIVVIGGLLAKSERSKQYWNYIAGDTKEIVSVEGDDMCMKILYLSYHSLPVHLKPCFLYMAAFPEDEIINVSLLIKLWVAEGILKPNSSKNLEVVAREYINDLISRNLILVYTYGRNGKIKSCIIHDLLRNLCLNEAREGKFLYALKMHSQDKVQSIDSQRRISSSASVHIPKQLDTRKLRLLGRSLMCPVALPLQSFKLLRVLKGYDENIRVADIYSIDDTLTLVNSRFIAIKTIERPHISPSICLLWNLQILIVKGVKEGPIAPMEIWEMTELRHLQFEEILYFPSPPNQLMSRQECDTVMKKLHTLKRIVNLRFDDEVVKRIPNITKLNIWYTLTEKELEEKDLQNLSLLENLESVTLLFALPTGSDLRSCLTFPNSLKKLSLQGCGFQWEEMSMIGSLPHLEVLKLGTMSFIGPEWVLVEKGFRCLKYLVIDKCYQLVHWIAAEDTPFPCLENLRLKGLDMLEEIPSSIGDIPTLRKIALFDCKNSAVISAKKILDELEELGNMDLQVTVICKKDAGLKNLASDNFRIVTHKTEGKFSLVTGMHRYPGTNST